MTAPLDTTTPDRRLCFSTLGCPDLTLRETASLGARHGFGSLELRCLSGLIIEPEHFASVCPNPAQIRTELENRGQRVLVLSTSIRLFATDRTTLHTLESFARCADDLGATYLRVFDGGRTGTMPTPEEWATATRLINDWQALRAKNNFRCDIVIETHWALTSPDPASEFLRRCPGISLIWDTHHTWKTGVPLAAFWNVARDHIVHLHVKDSRPDPVTDAGWSYCLPGEGEFPWPELQELLKRDKYNHAISLEWEKKWVPQLPPLDEAFIAFRRNGWIP